MAVFWAAFLDCALEKIGSAGHMITFCNGESHAIFYPEMYRRFDALATLVWNKGHVGLGRVWRHQHELIIAGRWCDAQFNEDDDHLRSDVITAKATPSAERSHPVEKPVALLEHLVTPTTKQGDTVLDPFMGSGTTLRTAKDMARKAIGVEIEERYCEIAANRLAQDTLF
jgi:site-specific DNA-methyltransferase (adenine-specific)